MSNLTAQQQQVLRAFNVAANRRGAGPKIRKALIEAGLVESGLRNLHYGDRDSLGALQQRPSAGWKNALNPEKAAEDFIAHAKPIAGQYRRAGDLAQAVQRSAFPGRYQQQAQTANQLLRASGRGASPSGSKGAATRTIPGKSLQGERRSLLLNFLLGNSGGDLLDTVTQISQLKDTPAKRVRVAQGMSNGGKVSTKGGLTTLDGKPVADWIAKRLERAKAAGWQGKVESGIRTDAQQTRIYKSGVRPAALPRSMGGKGSNHEFKAFPGGAVDVTDPQQLAATLKKLGIKKLQWAGSKDPVHFSHPRNGTY